MSDPDPTPPLETARPRQARGLRIGGRLLVRNTLVGLAGQVVPLAAVVFIGPFLIERLGEARAGVLAVCLAILNFAVLLDLGLGRALRKRVAEALGRGDRELAATITTTTVAAQLAMGAAGGLLFGSMASPLATTWLRIPVELQGEARDTFVIIAVALPVVVLLDSLAGVLEAAQRFGLYTAVRIPFFLAELAVPLYGVHRGWDLASIGAVQLGVTVAVLALYFIACASVVPELWRRPRFDRAELRRLIGFGKWVIVSNVLAPLLMYLDRLAIGALIGMTAVTAYTAPFEIVTRLSLIPGALAATLFPAFSTLRLQRRYETLRRYGRRAFLYLLLALAPITLGIVVFSRPLLEAWIGTDLANEGAVALSTLAVGVLANALAYVPFSELQARGRPDLCAKFHAIEVPVHAVLVFAFVHLWGIEGAALAWTFRNILDAALLFTASARLATTDPVTRAG